jgi:molybdopterin converting factor small subunit
VLNVYKERMPAFGWDAIAVAVNQEYAKTSDVLHDGDEVALLPPVSGGVQ